MSPLIHNICYLMLDFYVKTRIRFSLRDKRLFEITEVEITRVDCNYSSIIIKYSHLSRDLGTPSFFCHFENALCDFLSVIRDMGWSGGAMMLSKLSVTGHPT